MYNTSNLIVYSIFLYILDIPYYLYIHELRNNDVSLLNSYVPQSVKEKKKNISSQIKNISKHMILPITKYMLYTFQDLHKLPHGMHECKYKDESSI